MLTQDFQVADLNDLELQPLMEDFMYICTLFSAGFKLATSGLRK